MPIDANHVSNSKDRSSKPQESVGSTAHPMTREAASPWHERCYDEFFGFFFWWKEAYMSIDANHISNPKDR